MKQFNRYCAAFAAFAVLLSIFPVRAEDKPEPEIGATVAALSGSVETRADRKAEWRAAAKDEILPPGGLIRTGADGQAQLLFPNKTKIWLREQSMLEIEVRRELASNIALFGGKIKVRVPHLKWKERFTVRTDAAVCAVRGTEFVVSARETGELDLDVLYGQVDLAYNVPPEDGPREVQINQGVRYAIVIKPAGTGKEVRGPGEKVDDGERRGTIFTGANSLLTREQEVEGVQDWAPGLSPQQRIDMLVSKEGYRQDIRRFVADTDNTQNDIENLTRQVMEADLEAGRTLRDVEGNLVRVDQRMLRPDNNTLQIINLVKRPVYSASSGHYSYNGSDMVNRLDSLQTFMQFNQNLPQNLSDWGQFFANNSVRVDRLNIVAANQTTANSIFVTAMLAENKQLTNASASDELTEYGKVYFGTINPVNGDYNLLARGSVVSVNSDGSVQKLTGVSIPGLAWAQKPDAEGGWNSINSGSQDTRQYINENAPDGAMYGYQATPYCVGADCGTAANKIWMANDYFVINNDGNIRNVKSYTNDISNIPTLVANTAGQTRIYIKNNIAGTSGNPDTPDANGATGDFNVTIGGGQVNSLHRNIDIVAIPDIGLQAVEKMLPAFMKSDTKGSNK